jgi:serine/threonine protein kinase
MGTPPYMAPEYIAGGDAAGRAALYAMGVILFEGATGVLPFSSANGRDLFRQHLEDPPPRPRELRPEIPAAYESVILQALCRWWCPRRIRPPTRRRSRSPPTRRTWPPRTRSAAARRCRG